MNPYIKTNETEIDLLDLGRYLLRRFAWILLVGAICGAIGGALAYIHNRSNPQDTALMESERESESETETETEIEVEFDSKQYFRDLRRYEEESELLEASNKSLEELLRKQEAYLLMSPFLKLNPYHIWKASALIQIVSNDRDYPAYQVKELYKQKVTEGNYLKDLAKKRRTKEAYLKEMVSTSGSDTPAGFGGATTDFVLRLGDEERMTSELLLVNSVGDTQKEAQELLDAALEEVESYSWQIEMEYPHEIRVLDRYCSETMDTSIRTTQRDHETYTKALMDQVKDNKDKSNWLEKPKTEAELIEEKIEEKKAEKASRPPVPVPVIESETETEAPTDVKPPESPQKRLLKYAVIGFIIGVLFMCLLYFIRYMRNNLLVSYKDLERKGFSLKDLGLLSKPHEVAMAAASIRSFAGEYRKLFITGMAGKDLFDPICDDLKKELSGYQLVCMPDLLTNPNARVQLLDCDAVVLLEQKGVTKYSEMKDEVTFLYYTGKEIIGVMITDMTV